MIVTQYFKYSWTLNGKPQNDTEFEAAITIILWRFWREKLSIVG
jgi:hypothetical protein